MSVEATTRRLENVLQKTKRKHGTKKISDVFWIGDDLQHKVLYNKTKGNCCFNHQIGLPKSKISPFNEMPIFAYEKEIIDNIENHKDYALNKARGIGATELILRWILFKAIHNQVPNRKFLIITGIRLELARDHIRRLMELCERISFVVTGTASQDAIQIGRSQIIAIL